MYKDIIAKRSHELYWEQKHNCATTSIMVLSEVYNTKISQQIIDATLTMPGSGKQDAQCGLVNGVLMFLGILGRETGLANKEISTLAQDFRLYFNENFKSLICADLKPQPQPGQKGGRLCADLTSQAIHISALFIEERFKSEPIAVNG